MGGGSTRLDALVALLDSASNSNVRKMAATQIGDLVAAHPLETRPVLRRVRRLLRSTSWETRIAAGHAIGAIAQQSPPFSPSATTINNNNNDHDPLKVEPRLEENQTHTHMDPPFLHNALQFDKLDIDMLMSGGAMLFASSGDEYKDIETDLKRQTERLKKDLGLDDRFSSPQDMLGLKDEDLVSQPNPANSAQFNASPSGINDEQRTATADVVAEMSGAQPLSARERNRLKRMAKRKAREGVDTNPGRPAKRPRVNNPNDPDQNSNTPTSGPEAFSLSNVPSQLDEEDEQYERLYHSAYWDFQPTCEWLKQGLFETRWESRHGAAIGLRHILMPHAESAGRFMPGLLGQQQNASWLEDICCRLLCVLAMDRFGDFVGDAVVAPVREAAAMTMGASTRPMSFEATRRLIDKVFYLLDTDKSTQWEVRHASFLGSRYVLAVKEEMAEEILNQRFDSILKGLRDQDDDVRAVAAEAILPVVPNLVKFMPKRVPHLVATLWDALLDLDDISASTSSIMRLLSQITSHPHHPACNALWLDPNAILDSPEDDDDDEDSMHPEPAHVTMNDVLIELVPRLWPFMRHSSKAVRRSAIKLLQTLTGSFASDEFIRWVQPLYADLFSRLFRNILLETETDVLGMTQEIWQRAILAVKHTPSQSQLLVGSLGPALGHWIQASSQETRGEAASYDETKRQRKRSSSARRRKAAAARRAAKLQKARAGGSVIPQTVHDADSTPTTEGPYEGVVMQQNVAQALGLLFAAWPSNDQTTEKELLSSLNSPFGISRRVACDICAQWALASKNDSFMFPEKIRQALEMEVATTGGCAFAEVGLSVGSFFTDSSSFLDTLTPNLVDALPDYAVLHEGCKRGKKAVSARDIPDAALCARSIKPKMAELVTGDKWEYIRRGFAESRMQKRRIESIESLRMRMLASIGYMTLREEGSKVSLAASATSAIVSAGGFTLPQKVSPMIKSLTLSLRISKNPYIQVHTARAISSLAVRLARIQRTRPLEVMAKNLTKHLTADQTISDKAILGSITASEEVALDNSALAKRGSLLAFKEFSHSFGDNMFSAMPLIWTRISGPLVSALGQPSGMPEVVHSMKLLRALVAHISQTLHPCIVGLFPNLISICAAPHQAYANEAPMCLADVVSAIPSAGMRNVVTNLLPLLAGTQADKDSDRNSRRGAAVALKAVVDRLGTVLIPYAAFMVVPLITRMVDEDERIRQASAGVFGTLIRLMPLEGGAPDDPEMSESMAQERREARSFLGQLLGNQPRVHYELPVSIGDGITLRKYQQDCLDWLSFLNRYGLHGALCDDMGLGKTLMTLCMITGDFVKNRQEGRTLPSLVVCPSTIVAHWVQEAERFFGDVLGKVIHYAGLPRARTRIRAKMRSRSFALIVTSYEILSNDLKFFEHDRWNYLVLDEGHVIKNPKTRVAKAVRALAPNHRLILTGTPIQNSVLELWAMFDFLMPGFLGSEKMFKDTYAKPIMASRDGRCTATEQERGMVATEALHRQVLPFVLRRLKDDVLSELPPKIMQDYYCNMTPLQLRLYEDFTSEMTGSTTADGKQSGKSHVFQVLSYLRRLCSHPKLVLSPDHPEYKNVLQSLEQQGQSIDDIHSSAKLVGLKNILHECAIGQPQGAVRDSGGHRVLIFAQLKLMLDLVENDLFKVHMPDVTYLRLDGSVEASKRQNIVTRFNADPTIDCLLLTTHVGGLGLNLTGADTVIFLEHDWNPTKDLQAMDRAHRMGQKRTVNVYRLITRGTLEEKIMGIQKFKTHIANTVVNRDNSNLQSMNTEDLLNLFKVEDAEAVTATDSNADMAVGTGKGMKAALSGLGDLWEEKQYEDEYNMNDFLAAMNAPQKKE